MTAGRDPELRLRAYLEDGPTELPDRSYDSVRAQIDQTRQRVVLGPWRESQMINFARIAIAGAVVLVVAVLGYNLLPRSDQSVGPGSTPSPAATPSPSPSPSPSPAAVSLPVFGPLTPGTYYSDRSYGTQWVRLTFTMPAGWEADNGFLTKGPKDQPSEVMLTSWWVTHVFTDACRWEGTLVDAGTTVDELVNALAAQEGREASAPSDVVLGGFPATRIELTVPADLDVSTCSHGGNLRYWPGPGPDMNSGLCCNPPGNTDVVYVIDVDGKHLVVVARHYPDSPAENRAELQGILDSIQIEFVN